MLQNYSRYRLLEEFFDFSSKDFLIRELSRRIGLAQPSIVNHLDDLLKEGLIIKEKKWVYPTFRANRDGEMFRFLKKLDSILRIKTSGLLDHIYDSCFPTVIILFGSASRGEDIEGSDIDLYAQSSAKPLKLDKFEHLLNRKISVFFEENFLKLSGELKNNILNGTVLKGYVEVYGADKGHTGQKQGAQHSPNGIPAKGKNRDAK